MTGVTVIESPAGDPPVIVEPPASGTAEAVQVAQTIVHAARELSAVDQSVLDALRGVESAYSAMAARVHEMENSINSRLEVLQGLIMALAVEEAEEVEETAPVIIHAPASSETPPQPDEPPTVRRRKRSFI